MILGVTVNSSSSFANQIYKIPVIGDFGKIVTFKDYKIDNETSKGDIAIPKLENIENEEVEKLINDTINEKVDQMLEEQAVLDAEYKEAFLATGGTKADYNKIETIVDYNTYYQSEKIISFEIFKYQTLASAYNEKIYYNINLETGEKIALTDVLGKEIVEGIKVNIEEQMKNKMKADESLSYNTEWLADMDINENQSFYISENGDIIIVFAKYEVAPGYMGWQEFVVGNIN